MIPATFFAQASSSLTVWGWDYWNPAAVPVEATNLVAVACGNSHTVGLRADGTVTAWGASSLVTNIPAGVTNVVRVAAGGSWSPGYAIKENGDLIAWAWPPYWNLPTNITGVAEVAGDDPFVILGKDGTVTVLAMQNDHGQTNVPADLREVVDIAAGYEHVLALKADGTVLAWGGNQYGECAIPPGLSNVVAIAARTWRSMALRNDGTVVEWGYWAPITNSFTNIAMITAGLYHNLALTSNGTVLAWGDDYHGTTRIPDGLTNAFAVGAGQYFSEALTGNMPPFISVQPCNRTAGSGTSVSLYVKAFGSLPMTYQWRCNGTNIPGATLPVLRFVNAQTAQSGNYSVVVANPFGVVTSTEANVLVAGLKPAIRVQPVSRAIYAGDEAKLRVITSGSEPMRYQWSLNGANIEGATNATYSVPHATAADAGTYSVVVSNDFGAAISDTATLGMPLVRAWGINDFGQCAVPPTLSNVTAIAAPWDVSLVIKQDGTVAAWGQTAYGQTDLPADLTNVIALAGDIYEITALHSDGTLSHWGLGGFPRPPCSNVVAIAEGGSHTLVLNDDGTVTAWGNWIYGETNVPPDLRDVVAIAADDSVSVAMTADGTVVAWGYGYFGITNVPASATNVVAIAAGSEHSLALRGDGTVVAWGFPGPPNTNYANYVPAGLSNVVAIAAGGGHNLALRSDGTVVAWGDNEFGQATVPETLHNVIGIAAGYRHSLALFGDGTPKITVQPIDRTTYLDCPLTLYAMAVGAQPLSFQWQYNGLNLTGETNQSLSRPQTALSDAGTYSVVISNALGTVTSSVARITVLNGPPVIQKNPYAQTTYPGGTVAFQVTAVGNAPLSYQWYREGAAVPDATNALLTIPSATSKDMGRYTVEVRNAMGAAFSSEVQLTLVPVVSWGDNSAGQTELSPTFTNAVALSANSANNMALKQDGTVVAWGPGNWGQTNVPPDLTNVVAISAGAVHDLALTADGKVVAWGAGLSNANGTPIYGQCMVPADLTNVVAIAAGTYHSLALNSEGKVFAWGWNGSGACNVPADLSNVVAIAAGYLHSVGLKPDGTVVAWGNLNYDLSVPLNLPPITKIAASSYNIMALAENGQLYVWGQRYMGYSFSTPVSNVVSFAGGEQFCLALQRDGTVVVWGSNNYGQTNVPSAANNALAVAAGSVHGLALLDWGFASAPVRLAIADKNTGVQIQIPTVRGRSYALEYKDSLTAPLWIKGMCPPIPGDGTIHSILLDSINQQRFYRIRLQ